MINTYRRTLPGHPKLGRHVYLDSRSRAYAVQPASTPIRSRRHRSFIGVLDQGNVGACTGFAGCSSAYHAPFMGVGLPDWRYRPTIAGALAWYTRTTELDDFPGAYEPPDSPVDTGSDGLSASKVAKEAGVISGYRPALDLASSLDALMSGPGITGIPWYWSMFDAGSDGLLDADASSGLAGGHELCVDEVVLPNDPGNGTRKLLVGGPNSWGTSWGASGRWYLTAADWWSLRQNEGDVYFWTPVTQPAPVPTPSPADEAGNVLWTATRGWVGARHVGANAAAAKALATWGKSTGRS